MLSQLQDIFSIIPLSQDKIPLVQWQDAQHSHVRHDIKQVGEDFCFNGSRCLLGLVCYRTEAIDIDAKNDKALTERYINLVKATYPDIYQKLTIQRTMSGGYHWIYRCAEVEPNQKLAYNSEGKEFLETRGSGGLIAVAPSGGYNVIQGSLLNLQQITVEERTTLLNLARQCSLTPSKKPKAVRVKKEKPIFKKRDGSPIAKIPYGLNLTADQAKLYAQFIDFKLYNPQGRLTPKDYGRIKKLRVSNRYWLEKLVNAGWAYRDGKAYCLRSYDHVWSICHAKKSAFNANESRYYVSFKQIEFDDVDKKQYIKQVTQSLLEQTASNKRSQILHGQKTHILKSDNTTEFFSVRSAAKLFGFKSPVSGSKYRALFFEVVPSERKLRRASKEEYELWKKKEKHGVEFLYPCDRISLIL